MNPETDELLLAGQSHRLYEEASQYHSGKVPEVEDIVRLSWCGQQVGRGLLVHIHSGSYHHVTTLMILWVKLLPL